MAIIAPSVLSANFANLEKDIKKIEEGGALWLHYDVMDGHFVNNISFGYSILKDISQVTSLFLDVHLMISDPLKYVDQFIKSNASLITFHYEAYEDENKIKETIQKIKSQNVKVGMSIKPATPISSILPFIKDLDLVLVMSVEPGFGGQAFNPIAVDKIKELKTYIQKHSLNCLIEVDGGINETTSKQCNEVGVDVLVAGSYVFNHQDTHKAIASLM